MAVVQATVEELPDNKVRLRVEVPSHDVQHAVEHAASDLAGSMRIPGFRKGKVPMQVLLARVGKRRLYEEAVESHIGSWFLNAAARTRIRPVSLPEYGYEVPDSDGPFEFTATVSVQPTPEPPDWTKLEVPFPDLEVPERLVEHELDVLRGSVAELIPVEDRPAMIGDTVVLDLVTPDGDAQRDYVTELGDGRLLGELENAIVGMQAGADQTVRLEREDREVGDVKIVLKEIKEKVLPPLDDELARSASEFDSLAELRGEVEGRLQEQLEAEGQQVFREAVADALVDASDVDASGPLVEARTNELLRAFARSLERRGISLEGYLTMTGSTIEQLRDGLRTEAARSVARELVLEGVAAKLEIEIPDDEVEAQVRELAADDEDADELIAQLRDTGRLESIRDDLRLRAALDRVAADVTRIPASLADARDKLWTPEKEKAPADTKLWTPGSKESR
jgi:trigger factor